MSKKWLNSTKFYVRVYLSSPKGDKYMTLGPYEEAKAVTLCQGYLSSGICSWMEKVV